MILDDLAIADASQRATGVVWRDLWRNDEAPGGPTFYHYTSFPHLPQIIASGCLTLTDSNFSAGTRRGGPDVVWLTREDHRRTPQWAEPPKGRVRITVAPSATVQRFDKWAKRQDIDAAWLRMLEQAGGERAFKWHVTEEPIPADQWVRIEGR